MSERTLDRSEFVKATVALALYAAIPRKTAELLERIPDPRFTVRWFHKGELVQLATARGTVEEHLIRFKSDPATRATRIDEVHAVLPDGVQIEAVFGEVSLGLGDSLMVEWNLSS